MSIKPEEWRRIEIETFAPYEVSSLGRIRSSKGLVKPSPSHGGYLKFSCKVAKRSVTLRVAKCVAAAFLPPQPTSVHQLNHRNGDKTDNSAANLEWVTPSQNRKHAYAVGLQQRPFGSDNPASKLDAIRVREIRSRLRTGERRSRLAGEFGVSVTCVYELEKRHTWAHV